MGPISYPIYYLANGHEQSIYNKLSKKTAIDKLTIENRLAHLTREGILVNVPKKGKNSYYHHLSEEANTILIPGETTP